MSPLKDHLDPPCPTCGVAERVPCAGDKTCRQRIWNAVNRWWADYHQWTRTVPCQVGSCMAEAGHECKQDFRTFPDRSTPYGAASHGSRVMAATNWNNKARRSA